MQKDVDKPDAILKRWKDYEPLFTQLIKNLYAEIEYGNKWPKHFQSALDLLINVFAGEVVYTYHEILDDKIKLLFGGPDSYIVSRRG
ncbi:MAG: hypothetical protein VKM17_06020, partial [Cyanobacteriota bacterium]|nr:hypothetical protein [Cyanobacteriota bacterium]